MTRFVAVYGTKGGVGKSTIAVNLAYALREQGDSVGLVDLDLSGPNVQNLVSGLAGQAPSMKSFRIVPGQYGGVGVIGLGFFVDPQDAGLLTGKYLEGALEQILFHHDWTSYDYVIIDMPPGFGDLHRRVFERLAVSVVLITTPHLLSTQDLARGRRLLEQLQIPVLGYVENMSEFCCEHCGRISPLFPAAHDESLNTLASLGRLPFLPASHDEGVAVPLILSHSGGGVEFRQGVRAIASQVRATLGE